MIRNFLCLLLFIACTVQSEPRCSKVVNKFEDYTCLQETGFLYETDRISYWVRKDEVTFRLVREVETEAVLNSLDNMALLKGAPFVAQLVEYTADFGYVYSIQTYGSQGSLFNFVKEKIFFEDTDNLFKFFIKVLRGLKNIQNKGFILTDLDDQSITIDTNYQPIIVNFNNVVRVDSENSAYWIDNFMAPEIIRSFIRHDKMIYSLKTNIYSFGVLLYKAHKKRLPIDIVFGDYDVLMTSPISFNSKDKLDFYQIILMCLMPLSSRGDYDSLKAKLTKAISNPSDELLSKKMQFILNDFANSKEKAGVHYGVGSYLLVAIFGIAVIVIITYGLKKRKKKNSINLNKENEEHFLEAN